VKVEERDQSVAVMVVDDGVGFIPQEVASKDFLTKGAGLLGIEERVAAGGGMVAIHSALGEGTTIRAEFPLVPG